MAAFWWDEEMLSTFSSHLDQVLSYFKYKVETLKHSDLSFQWRNKRKLNIISSCSDSSQDHLCDGIFVSSSLGPPWPPMLQDSRGSFNPDT